jgi:hypothetical protein
MRSVMAWVVLLAVATVLGCSGGAGGGTTNPPVSAYTLNVAVTGQGTVERDVQASYPAGTTLTLQAVPASGWVFSAWSGDVSGSTNPVSVVMTGNKTVTATFVKLAYNLNLAVVGQGTITRTARVSYTAGTTVDLTAVPASGWNFTAWSGDATGTVNPTSVVMNGHKSVTATFTQQSSGTGDSDIALTRLTAGTAASLSAYAGVSARAVVGIFNGVEGDASPASKVSLGINAGPLANLSIGALGSWRSAPTRAAVARTAQTRLDAQMRRTERELLARRLPQAPIPRRRDAITVGSQRTFRVTDGNGGFISRTATCTNLGTHCTVRVHVFDYLAGGGRSFARVQES